MCIKLLAATIVTILGIGRCLAQATGEYWQVPGQLPTSLTIAESIVANYVPSTSAPVSQIDFLDNFYGPPYSGGGHFPQGVLFPGVLPIQQDPTGDFFVFRVSGIIDVPTAGIYTFGSTSDDGARVRIDGQNVLEHEGPIFESFATVNLSTGLHDLEVLYYAINFADQLEIYSQPGAFTSFNSGFRVVGDVSGGGIAFVPEPGSVALMVVGVLVVIRRRH